MGLGRRTDLNWDKIRRAWMLSGNVRDVARQFGMSRVALQKHIRKYGWRDERALLVDRAKQRDDARLEVSIADTIGQQADFALSLVEDLKAARDRIMLDGGRPASQIESLRSLVDALHRATHLHLDLRARLGESVELPEDDTTYITVYESVVKQADGTIVTGDGTIVKPRPSGVDPDAPPSDTTQTA